MDWSIYLFGYLDAMISVIIAIVFLIYSWKRILNDSDRDRIKNSKILQRIYNLL